MTRWKQGLAWAGFVAALLAVMSDRAVVGWVAILLLGLAFGIRLVERARARGAASARDNVSASRDE